MNSNFSIFIKVSLLLAWFHNGAWAQEPLTHAMTLHDRMEYAIIGVLVVTVALVTTRSFCAATRNPVESIKAE